MNVATILKHKGRSVVTVKPDTTLLEACQYLGARKIGAAVVVDASGAIRGIVSERDIVRALAEAGAESLKQPVSHYMSAPVRTCSEADSIDQVLALMTARRFRHLPVVESERLAGIVSIGDVVKLKIAETELEVAAMREYIAQH
jgi:CBS domain-containing protein